MGTNFPNLSGASVRSAGRRRRSSWSNFQVIVSSHSRRFLCTHRLIIVAPSKYKGLKKQDSGTLWSAIHMPQLKTIQMAARYSESMVKTTKSALRKIIGAAVLTPFELYTCLLEVANLVNERPIGRIPNDPDDGAYLCTNDISWAEPQTEYPKVHFATRITHDTELSSVKNCRLILEDVVAW